MGALIYVLIVFVSLIILFFIEAFAELHVMWILGIILSYPAFRMLCRTLQKIALALLGRKAVGGVIQVSGQDYGIVTVRYRDMMGNLHETEERAIYGFIKRKRPPEQVMIRYFQAFPKQICIGWRTVLYWMPIDLFWIAFTVLCWIAFTGWGV